MASNHPNRILEVMERIVCFGDSESDFHIILEKIRALVLGKLEPRSVWSVSRLVGEKLSCHVDTGEGFELVEDRTRATKTPLCAMKVLENESTFSSPANFCAECVLKDACEGSLSRCAPLVIGDDSYGVMGILLSDAVRVSGPEWQSICAQTAVAIHLSRARNEREKATSELQKASTRMELALNGGALGIWDWNILSGEMSFDRHWNHIFDLSVGDKKAWKTNPWERILPDGDVPAVYEARFSNGDTCLSFYESEHHVSTRTKEQKWVLIKGSVTERSDTGEPLRASGTILDITSRKANEREKDKLAEQLRQIQKIESIGRLAGGIAHDLNNLLSPVIGYSEMALFDLHPEDTLYEDISQIRDAAERAKDLTHQLLAFSRKQVLDMQAINISSIVMKSESIIRRLIREDIEIMYRVDPELSTVKGDSSQIQQILMNLATNAADSMPDGGRMIIETQDVVFDDAYVSFHPVAEKGNYAMLSVSDTGFGMGKETLECIFDPFFTTKTKGRGTGLGLSTVYGIVKQHGGYVWAYSEPGLGTTLKVYIPIVEEKADVDRNSSYNPDDTTGSETILVVEDEEAVRRLICKVLDKQGYDVLEAMSAENALEIVRADESIIHLLLTDVVMPVMNGKELYDKVVAVRPEIKVCYVSGYTDDVIAHHGVLDDGVRFVQKPFSVESLTTKVRKALDD